MGEATFTFQPRWKEELVCTGPGGSFILYLPMGVLTVCLPTEDSWTRCAPEWARSLWPRFKQELEAWCEVNDALLEIDPKAGVYPFR